MSHARDFVSPAPEDPKESVGVQLDAFAAEHKLRSIRDRLNTGLNEVGILAVEQTRKSIETLCERVAGDHDKAKQLYEELVGMCVDIQQAGPWDYAPELNNPTNEAARLWQMLTFALSREFVKDNGEVLSSGNGQVLNNKEFFSDIERIVGNLEQAAISPDNFFQEARADILEGVDRYGVRLESFAKKVKKNGRGEKQVPEKILKGKEVKQQEWDPTAFAPIADKFEGFMIMALKGAEAGIVKSDDGEVFVGARGQIEDSLIESCGLVAEKKVEYDRPGSTRELTYFRPVGSPQDNNHDVIKKVHGGFLVVLTRNLDLAKSIVEALAHKKEAVKIAEESLGHTRVIQTSEGKADKLDREHEIEKDRRAFLSPNMTHDSETSAESNETALVSQREVFYQKLWDIRGKYVYLDALKSLERDRSKKGQQVTENDKAELIKNINKKMWQKVEEIMYINQVIDQHLHNLPPEIRRVIDMAGGAGDIGLGVTMELLVRGRQVDGVEIVDPQDGTNHFMRTIIANLPLGLRTQFEQIAHHALDNGTGYLQETPITPDAMVVAKHACGTLTDDIIHQWKGSESKLLVAMTCCQDKACGHPARYGFSQEDWDRLTMETGWTNLEDQIRDSSGNKKEQLEEKLKKGKEAMQILDQARVNYLRRHGFAAELITTDKFPKGDVIIARRLPKDFPLKLAALEKLEKEAPTKFDATIQRLDILARGKDAGGLREEYGPDWSGADFQELVRHFETKNKPGNGNTRKKLEAKQGAAAVKKPVESEQDRVEVAIFGKKLAVYLKAQGVPEGKQFGQAMALAKKRMGELKSASPEDVKIAVDGIIKLYTQQV